MWAKMSDRELVGASEVIARAELIGRTRARLTSDGSPMTLGILKVSELLKGKAGARVLRGVRGHFVRFLHALRSEFECPSEKQGDGQAQHQQDD